MKIVQLITGMDTVGGAQIHVRDIIHKQTKLGHTIYLITGGDAVAQGLLEKENVSILHSKYLNRNIHFVSDMKAIIELRKMIKNINPDVIATHSSKAGIVGRIAGWSLGKPTIFTAHGWSFTDGVSKWKKWLYIFIEKMVGYLSDGVITVSEYDKQLAMKYKVISEKKMITIHNGVHDRKEAENNKNSAERIKIIMVARFSPPKRQLQLIQTLKRLQHLQWEMNFVGNGPLLKSAKEYVDHNGLSDRVNFLGYRSDVIELLNQSHIFVLLSDWEGLPLSILEAMRSHLPILASDVGGVKETVFHEKNGFLIPKNDEYDLLHKLAYLITNPSIRIRMGQQSRSLYEKSFTFENMHKKTIAFYKDSIEKKKIGIKELEV